MNHEADTVTLSAAADRHSCRIGGGEAHLLFTLKVSERVSRPERIPAAIALVLDRSGSMHGDKIAAARTAAIRVISSLAESDRFSVVAFDDRITTLVPCTAATNRNKQAAIEKVERLQARGSTNLHEGWLTGCRDIAGDKVDAGVLSRCFLLTDGLANCGETDPEAIASQAGDVRLNTGIRTSTFGIGEDYDETLLAPMAVAGGGQFHHLRRTGEIERTFSGELAELFSTAVQDVRIELLPDRGMQVESISDYHLYGSGAEGSLFLDIGNLMAGEERRLVMRAVLPAMEIGERKTLPFRLHWISDGEPRSTDYVEFPFTGAADDEYSRESPDPEVLHWMGMHQAARTKRIFLTLLQRGRRQEASSILQESLSRFESYPAADKEIRKAQQELDQLMLLADEGAEIDQGVVKDVMYHAQLYSRSQRNFRDED